MRLPGSQVPGNGTFPACPGQHSPGAGCQKTAPPLVAPGNQLGRPPAPAHGPQRPPHRGRHFPRCLSLRGHRALPLTHPEDPPSPIAAPRFTAQLRPAPTTRLRYGAAPSPLLASDRVPLSRPPPGRQHRPPGGFPLDPPVTRPPAHLLPRCSRSPVTCTDSSAPPLARTGSSTATRSRAAPTPSQPPGVEQHRPLQRQPPY